MTTDYGPFYDPEKEAYQYDREGRTIRNVVINSNEIPPQVMQIMQYCFESGCGFILRNSESAIGFWPAVKTIIFEDSVEECESPEMFNNRLKLFLLTHKEIKVHEKKLSFKEVKSLKGNP